jgi:AraC-like DNA-binding protein
VRISIRPSEAPHSSAGHLFTGSGPTEANEDAENPGAHRHYALAKLLLGFTDVVRELGGSPSALLDNAAIEPTVLTDPMAMVPLISLGQLLEDTASCLGCPDFGLRLAERTSMEAIMAPLDRLFCAAPSIADAFECCIRHMDAFNSGLIMDLDRNWSAEKGFLHFQLIDGLALYPQLVEQLVLLTHESVRFLSGGFARSRTVWFSHLAISQPAVYARRFNTVVRFDKEYDGLFFSPGDLASPVIVGDTQLFEEEARNVAQRFPVQCKGIDIVVRQAIVRVLNIAALLSIQERTLNRRLSKVGTSFEAIRDKVRRDLAFRYLARDDISLTEIASRLGYSELAVLSRSCRRWFGAAPRQFRSKLMSVRPPMKRSAPQYNRRLAS